MASPEKIGKFIRYDDIEAENKQNAMKALIQEWFENGGAAEQIFMLDKIKREIKPALEQIREKIQETAGHFTKTGLKSIVEEVLYEQGLKEKERLAKTEAAEGVLKDLKGIGGRIKKLTPDEREYVISHADGESMLELEELVHGHKRWNEDWPGK